MIKTLHEFHYLMSSKNSKYHTFLAQIYYSPCCSSWSCSRCPWWQTFPCCALMIPTSLCPPAKADHQINSAFHRSVNEDTFGLGRQRQMWFILLVYKPLGGRLLWDPLTMRVIRYQRLQAVQNAVACLVTCIRWCMRAYNASIETTPLAASAITENASV